MIFMLVAMTVLAIVYGYMGRRVVGSLPLSVGWKRLLRIYLFLCWVCSPVPIVLRFQGVDMGATDWLSWFVYLNMGVASLVFACFIVLDMTLALMAFLRRLLTARPPALNDSRRQFIANSMNIGVLGLAGAASGFGVAEALGEITVKHVAYPIENLPKGLESLRIVQFTDLHVGPTIKRAYVERVVETIQGLNPDIIVMTGDMVDGLVEHLKHDVAPLGELKATYGKFFITGNHEYYSGAPEWVGEMRRLGYRTLLNEHELIEHAGGRLLLAGVTDYKAHQYIPEHRSSPKKAMEGAPNADVKLLLAHQPRSLFAAAEAGFDIQISGHTHGGQYYPWVYFAAVANPYIKGLHRHDDKMWVYVSSGTGYWGPPVRIGTEPEVTLHTLRAA